MTLQIRDPKAVALARALAEKRNLSTTQVVIMALEAELRRGAEREPLAARAKVFAAELRSRSRGSGRDPSKDEVDAMWGND